MYVKKLNVTCKGYFKRDRVTGQRNAGCCNSRTAHGEREEGHEIKRKKGDVKWTKGPVRIANNKCARLLSREGAVILDSRLQLQPLRFRRRRRGAARRGAASCLVSSHLCPDRSIVSRIVPMKKQKHNLYRGKRRRKLDKDRATALQRLGQEGICQSKRASLIDGNNIGIVLINYSSDIGPIRSIQLRRVHRYVSLTTTSRKAMLLNGD